MSGSPNASRCKRTHASNSSTLVHSRTISPLSFTAFILDDSRRVPARRHALYRAARRALGDVGDEVDEHEPPALAVTFVNSVTHLADERRDAAVDLEEHEPFETAVLQEPRDFAHGHQPALAPELETRARRCPPVFVDRERDEVGPVAQPDRQLDFEVRVLAREHRVAERLHQHVPVGLAGPLPQAHTPASELEVEQHSKAVTGGRRSTRRSSAVRREYTSSPSDLRFTPQAGRPINHDSRLTMDGFYLVTRRLSPVTFSGSRFPAGGRPERRGARAGPPRRGGG